MYVGVRMYDVSYLYFCIFVAFSLHYLGSKSAKKCKCIFFPALGFCDLLGTYGYYIVRSVLYYSLEQAALLGLS